MARTFDDVRRSNAFVRLAAMRQETVITDDEFANFSPDTRDSVNALQEALGRRRK